MLHRSMHNNILLREEEYMQLMCEKLWNRTKKKTSGILNSIESTCSYLNSKKEMCAHTRVWTQTQTGELFCKDIFPIFEALSLS